MASTNKAYISAITLLDEVEYNPLISDIQREDGLMDILNIADRTEVTKVPVYYNTVNAALRVQGDTTGATVGTSGTPQVTTTLTAGTSGYVRKGDICKFPNGKTGYVTVVTSTSTDALTIKSADGSNLTHTAGQKLDFFSSAVGEQSTKPANRRYSLTVYSNNIQSFREVDSISDIQKVSAVRVEYNGQPYIFMKNWNEKIMKLRGDINAAFIGGTKSSSLYSDSSPSLTDPVAGGAVQLTGGLDYYVTGYGVNDTVDVAGTFDLDDLEQHEALLLANKSGGEFMLVCGTKVKNKLQNCLKNLNSAGITAGRMNLDGKEVNMQVERFSYGFDYMIKKMGILDSPNYFSQTDIVKSFYLIPTGNVGTMDNGSQPRIKVRYQPHGIQNNTGNKLIGEWATGALSPAANTDEAVYEKHWLTHQGLEVLGAQHFSKCAVL
jgi:hypothetical protein